ncbi:MAG: rhomboid family intramembrane serine protease [Chthoniobacterales bacterium]
MDLNRLFLFIVIVSSLLVLGRSVRRPQTLPWISALIVLAITGIAFLFARRVAGWIAITAWLVILFLPAMISGWRRRVPGRPRQLTLTPVVTMLIVANAAMFLVELALGGSMNPETLHRLGELDSAAVWFNHEYWRLFTALFLHYGALHLAFNLYALWIIGPGLERAIGGLRFIVCYLVAGVGSSIGVVLLRAVRLTTAEQLVGASGCVMGIVGAWAGLLLRRRDLPMAGKRLQNIVIIVAIQTAFDLSTPQVSLGAHLSGLVVGFVVGFLVAPRPNLADTIYAR